MMSDEETSDEGKDKIIQEEDEHGNIISYPIWSKKNAPKERQDKWEVPIYL
jgi:hypothetical protein